MAHVPVRLNHHVAAMPLTRLFHNRIATILAHIPRYAVQGPARLAYDIGVSRSSVHRLLTGEAAPSFALALAVLTALEKALGRRLDFRDLISFDGTYPTASVCDLCGCRGCLPPGAWDDEKDEVRPEFRGAKAKEWTTLQDGRAAPLEKGGPMD